MLNVTDMYSIFVTIFVAFHDSCCFFWLFLKKFEKRYNTSQTFWNTKSFVDIVFFVYSYMSTSNITTTKVISKQVERSQVFGNQLDEQQELSKSKIKNNTSTNTVTITTLTTMCEELQPPQPQTSQDSMDSIFSQDSQQSHKSHHIQAKLS